jgi:hypothetical protein
LRGRAREGTFTSKPVNPHRPHHVLERLLAHVVEGEIEAARIILLHSRRNANAARLGQFFKSRCDVDAVAENVGTLDNDVTHIDADAEFDAAVRRR